MAIKSRALIPYIDSPLPVHFVAREGEKIKFNQDLKKKINHFMQAILPLHRLRDDLYKTLPWPSKIKNIVVFTKVIGGLGDLSAAGKMIGVLQNLFPDAAFDWVLKDDWNTQEYEPLSFLNCQDHSKIKVRTWVAEPPENPGDLLVIGPASTVPPQFLFKSYINRIISGPIFVFLENCKPSAVWLQYLKPVINRCDQNGFTGISHKTAKIFYELLPIIFPETIETVMGLEQGTGLFLDKTRVQAPLSRNHCCPTYLMNITNSALKKDLLTAMDVHDAVTLPDYDVFSLNSGYAHHPCSWEKFIDCIAIHEKTKHLVVVLNQKGASGLFSNDWWQKTIFTKERIAFLKERGFGNIFFKTESMDQVAQLDQEDNKRRLTIIAYPLFAPDDMRWLQLASERLLATGDNSAAEAFAARCQLYFYEDVDSKPGYKWRFLQQQVDLAHQFSPNFAKLLALFGGDKRYPSYNASLNKPLNREQMIEMEQLLNAPNLSSATLQFCHHIIDNYSFEKNLEISLEGSLKRAAWHRANPELLSKEKNSLWREYLEGVTAYLTHPHLQEIPFNMTKFSLLKEAVKEEEKIN